MTAKPTIGQQIAAALLALRERDAAEARKRAAIAGVYYDAVYRSAVRSASDIPRVQLDMPIERIEAGDYSSVIKRPTELLAIAHMRGHYLYDDEKDALPNYVDSTRATAQEQLHGCISCARRLPLAEFEVTWRDKHHRLCKRRRWKCKTCREKITQWTRGGEKAATDVRREMLLDALIERGDFTIDDFAALDSVEYNVARVTLQRMVFSGRVFRVRHGVYRVTPPEERARRRTRHSKRKANEQ